MNITLEQFHQINVSRDSFQAWLKENKFVGWPYADINWKNRTVFIHI
jgi:hypothetical protein